MLVSKSNKSTVRSTDIQVFSTVLPANSDYKFLNSGVTISHAGGGGGGWLKGAVFLKFGETKSDSSLNCFLP